MSRTGKQPITIPSGVKLDIEGKLVKVTGPKGTLELTTLPGISLKMADNELIVSRANDKPDMRAIHGLSRTLINNMIIGVNEGFSKQLQLTGVGFRVNLSGSNLNLSVGLSHEIVYKIPEGITASVEQNTITISGIDKQKVGQSAAEIRKLKKPEPYKGKGITYVGERIVRKSVKSGKE